MFALLCLIDGVDHEPKKTALNGIHTFSMVGAIGSNIYIPTMLKKPKNTWIQKWQTSGDALMPTNSLVVSSFDVKL